MTEYSSGVYKRIYLFLIIPQRRKYCPCTLFLEAHSQVWDIFGNWKSFKSYEKRFLFHLKSSFRSHKI